MSLIVKLDPDKPDDHILKKVISAIKAGETIAFPTETFYALGVSAYSETAIRKVYAIKGREQGKPLPLIIEGELHAEGGCLRDSGNRPSPHTGILAGWLNPYFQGVTKGPFNPDG